MDIGKIISAPFYFCCRCHKKNFREWGFSITNGKYYCQACSPKPKKKKETGKAK